MSSTSTSVRQACVGESGVSSADQDASRRNSADFRSPLPSAHAESVETNKHPAVTTPNSGTSLGNQTLTTLEDALPCNDASLSEGQIATVSTCDEPTEGRSAFSTTQLVQDHALEESADVALDETSPNVLHTETERFHNVSRMHRTNAAARGNSPSAPHRCTSKESLYFSVSETCNNDLKNVASSTKISDEKTIRGVFTEAKTENMKDSEIGTEKIIQSFEPKDTLTNAGSKTGGNAGTENKTDDFKLASTSDFMIPTSSLDIQDIKFEVTYPEVCKKKLENFQGEAISIPKASSAPAKTVLFTPGKEVVSITDTFNTDKVTSGNGMNYCVNVIVNHAVSDIALINPAIQMPQRNDVQNSELGEIICVNEKRNDVLDQVHVALECHAFEEGKTEVENIGQEKQYFGDTTNGHGSVVHKTVLNSSLSFPSQGNSEFQEVRVSQIVQALDGQNSMRELKFADRINSAIRIQSIDKAKIPRRVDCENDDDITPLFPIRENHASIETESILNADTVRILNSASNYRKHLQAMKCTKQSGILKHLQEQDPCGGHGIKKIKLPIGTFKGVSLTKCPQMAGNALETGPFWEQYRRQYCLMLEMVAVNARPVDPVGFYFLKKEIHNYMQVPETRGKCHCYSQRTKFSKFTHWLRKIFCLS